MWIDIFQTCFEFLLVLKHKIYEVCSFGENKYAQHSLHFIWVIFWSSKLTRKIKDLLLFNDRRDTRSQVTPAEMNSEFHIRSNKDDS